MGEVQEFCKVKAHYPLWTLSYCENTNKTLSGIVSEIITLLDQESPSLESIKELSQSVIQYKDDLEKLMSEPANYEEGFNNFMLTLSVNIKLEWWDEMLRELSYMPSEVAFRKEADVKNKILEFYIEKTNPKPKSQSEPKRAVNPATGQPYTTEETVVKAKECVKTAILTNILWQRVMIDVIDEYPDISDYVIKYLS